MVSHVLFETASGYALFERLESDEINQQSAEFQQALCDLAKFSKIIKLKSFVPFKSATDALENAHDISEGVVNESLRAFLELNISKKKCVLGVIEKNLAGAIKEELGIECVSSELVQEIARAIRLHASRSIKPLKDGDIGRAQLGLGHAYSRAKLKFNVHRSDNMIIQAINILDSLDKDINTFAMRVREWYSWHFPELVKIANDNQLYARLTKRIRNKASLSENDLTDLTDILNDEAKAQQILDASRSSMGTDISEIDLLNIENFADRVISLMEYRKNLYAYLVSKMHLIAPNLSSLIGEVVGARLISHAGSLTNLSKAPASTVQILGAEKALFRALKTKGNTPKYGLIYHSSFITKAGQKNKGRISRFLANKCSIASRIDCFTDSTNTSTFGDMMREQVEERLRFYESGDVPRKNADVMAAAVKEAEKAALEAASTATAEPADAGTQQPAAQEESMDVDTQVKAPESRKSKKKDKKAAAEENSMEVDSEAKAAEPQKSKKKDKKRAAQEDSMDVDSKANEDESQTPKKKSKKSKKSKGDKADKQ